MLSFIIGILYLFIIDTYADNTHSRLVSYLEPPFESYWIEHGIKGREDEPRSSTAL
jgi:hypothetical protein